MYISKIQGSVQLFHNFSNFRRIFLSPVSLEVAALGRRVWERRLRTFRFPLPGGHTQIFKNSLINPNIKERAKKIPAPKFAEMRGING